MCDQTKYLDALNVPALALPKRAKHAGPTGFEAFGTKTGDLLVAMAPGSVNPFMLWSVNGALRNIKREPKNYKDVKRNWEVERAVIVIFPKSRNDQEPYLTSSRIDVDARKRFEEWGARTLEHFQAKWIPVRVKKMR